MTEVLAGIGVVAACAAVAVLVDWLSFDRVMFLAPAVWARPDDFAYRNYLVPRVIGVASGGAIIGLGALLDSQPMRLAGGVLFLISHVAVYVMVVRDSNRSD